MSIFPIITAENQKSYEKVHIDYPELNNSIPSICGYYGRACRRMGDKAYITAILEAITSSK